MSKNHFRYRSLSLLIASLHSFAPLSAAELYLGDSAAEGANILTANSGTYSIEELTIVMHTGSPVIYTAPAAQELLLTEVNFVSAYAVEGVEATLTPFIAVFDGINSQEGSSYQILATGDPITVNAIETVNTPELINEAFTVNGANPTISVNANDQIVAGFLEQGRIITMTRVASGAGDYIARGDSISAQSVGDPLADISEFDFDRQLDFNIGFDVLSSDVPPPIDPPLPSADIYLGDAAAEGLNILEANSGTYNIEELTIVMHTGSPVIYTPTVAQELILTQVNFVSAYTDASVDGFLTPFVAAYDETNNNGDRAHAQGGSYRILAIGDPIAVNTTPELKNEAFTINGVNPTISVDADEQIVAGFLQEGRIITRSATSLTSGLPDYIFSGDSISGQPVGDPLVGNSAFDTNNFDRQLDFNIGFDVVDNTPPALDLDLGDIWFIGDSITQSNADGDDNSSPRASLLNLLLADNVDFTYTGHFTADNGGLPVTGSTPETNLYDYHSGISASVIGDDLNNRVGMTANLETGIDFWNTGRLDTVKPEIILIKLGTNDVGQNFELATAPARISTLVDEILTLPNVGSPAFFISTIAPNRRSTREINDVAAFNAALPDIVAAQQLAGREVFLVDNFTPLNDDYDNLMRNDDLHPNATGNNVMAQQWYDAIMQRFDPEPGTSFADWQFENFGSSIATNASQELDPDGDSATNFNEFAFGGDPNTADNNVRVAPLFDGLFLQFTRREASAAGLTYTLQESATLQEPDWFDVTDASVNVLSTDGAFENVEFTRPGGFIQAPRNFYRLNAIETP